MQNVMNRRWLLAAHPEGMPTVENWTLDTQPVPDPGPGQMAFRRPLYAWPDEPLSQLHEGRRRR